MNDRKRIAIRQTIATGLALLGLLFVVGKCTACFEQPAQVAAAAGYEAQQMRCVEQYATRKDIDRCRGKVKAAWLLDQAKDAGPDVANVGFDNDGGQWAKDGAK